MSTIPPSNRPAEIPQARLPTAGRAPDPGGPVARMIALLILVVFFGATFYLQQTQHAAPLPAPGINAGTVAPPGADPATWVSKFAVKFSHSDIGAGSGGQLMPQLDEGARTPVEKIRIAMVAADVLGVDSAIRRLKTIASDHGLDEALVTGAALRAPPEPPDAEPARVTDGMAEPAEGADALHPLLVEDLQTLGALYRGQESAVTADQREGLIERHGWFGRLAATQSLDDKDPARREVIGGGDALILLTLATGLGFGAAFFTGTGLLIYFLVRIFGRSVTWRMDAPSPGGSVYLETAAVFVFCFVMFKLVMELISGGPSSSSSGPVQAVRISAQWLLLLPVLWPLVRGVRFASMRRAIGWHSGRGVLREMGAGCVAYLAGIPILVGAAVCALVLFLIWEAIKAAMGQPPSPPPENPIIEVIGGSDPWVLISFVVLATLWAPVVEESIFRGCLYRHARSRSGPLLAGVVSALVFGGMHGYAGPLLLPVTSLGFVFALMREWRGSLIAPMTAHFLHNATVTAVLLAFITLLGR